MTPCVCGCPPENHHAYTGRCHGLCGCGSYEPDTDERIPDSVVSSGRPSFPYDGTYSKHYTLEDECSA